MITKKMEKAINEQIKWEFYSAYLYLGMAAWFERQGLPGCANWMRVQREEETFHAMKFLDYLLERGGTVELLAIDAPEKAWKTPAAVFEHTQKHEAEVTRRINALMDLAMKEKDHAAVIFLQWFVSEQVEEEASVAAVLDKVKLVGDGPSFYLLDQELAARVFTPPMAA
jgi:ferritin